MNEKNFFVSNEFEKRINRGVGIRSGEEMGAKKIKKLISWGASIRTLRV